MIQWWQEVVNNWDWFVFIPEALGKATGVLIGILLSWFLVIRRRLRSLDKLQRGDSDGMLS